MSGFSGKSLPADVVEAAKSGSREAHAAIYVCFADPVFTLARRLVVDTAKAEDVLQETFIEVIRSIPGFRGDASLATWIRHIAVSKALMLLRSSWEKRRETLPYEDRIVGSAGEPMHDQALLRALERLDAASRTVVWLYDVEGYTHVEIAALMKRTVSYSKSRLARAHATLRDVLTADSDSASGTNSGALLAPMVT